MNDQNSSKRQIYYKYFSLLMIIFIAIYLPRMANLSLSVDDENTAVRTDPTIWIAQGRWGSYFVERFIVQYPVIPYFTELAFGLSIVAGYIALSHSFRLSLGSIGSLLCYSVFISFPIWSFILEFYGNTVAVGAGLALVCFCAGVLNEGLIKDRKLAFARLVGSSLALSVSISTYQSFLFLYVAICAALLLNDLLFPHLPFRELLTKTGTFLGAAVMGLCFYYIVWKFALRITHTQPQYIQSFFDPASLIENFNYVLLKTLSEVLKVYFGYSLVYAVPNLSFALLFIVAVVAILIALAKAGPINILLGLPLLLIIFLVPFLLNLFSGGFVPYRSLVGIPFAIWFLATALERIASGPWKKAVQILLCLVVMQSIYSLAIFDANQRFVERHDELLAEQLYQKIIEVRAGETNPAQAQLVDFFGARTFSAPYPRVYSSTAGYSFFEWDGGNPYRILNFMKLLGYGELRTVAADVRASLIPQYLSMPNWPAPGSVKLVNNIVLVKLGDTAGTVHQTASAQISNPIYDSAVLKFDNVAVPVSHSISTKGDLQIHGNENPQLDIDLGSAAGACQTIQVNVHLKTTQSGTSQLFYLPKGQKDYSDKIYVDEPMGAADQLVTFYAHSDTGFEPRLRLNVASSQHELLVHRIEVGCLD